MTKGRNEPSRQGRPPRGRDYARRPKARFVRTRVLLVTEGLTEQNYFDGLKREDVVAARFAITVHRVGRGHEAVVQKAIQLQTQAAERSEEYDEVWCVADTEARVGDNRALMASLNTAQASGLTLLFSNPSFEVWLLAHFQRTSRSFQSAQAVIDELNKSWLGEFGCNYAKNDEDIYRRLSSRTDTAISNAKSVHQTDHPGKEDVLDCNSATDVYRLVEHLLHGPPEGS